MHCLNSKKTYLGSLWLCFPIPVPCPSRSRCLLPPPFCRCDLFGERHRGKGKRPETQREWHQPRALVAEVTNLGEGPDPPISAAAGCSLAINAHTDSPIFLGISRKFESIQKSEGNRVIAPKSYSSLGGKNTPNPPAAEPNSPVRVWDNGPPKGRVSGKISDLGALRDWGICEENLQRRWSATELTPSFFCPKKIVLLLLRRKSSKFAREHCCSPEHRKSQTGMERRRSGRKAASPLGHG